MPGQQARIALQGPVSDEAVGMGEQHGAYWPRVAGLLLHDRDKLLAWDFDTVLAAAEAKVVKTPFRAPDANAYAERWVRSVTGEWLVLNQRHLERLLREYLARYYHAARPHQGLGGEMPVPQAGSCNRAGGTDLRARARWPPPPLLSRCRVAG
jgi:transposase InsO family protein